MRTNNIIRVCHLTSRHGEEDGRIFRKECVSLAKLGYEVYLVERGKTYDKNGVHIVGVDLLQGRKHALSNAKKIYNRAKALQADIYHFHDPDLLLYALRLKRTGAKVIFDSHERYTIQIKEKPYLPKWSRKIIAAIYGCYESYVLRRIDGVVFPCTQEGVNPFEKKCRETELINNVPIIEEMDISNGSERGEEFFACYVGAMRQDRGLVQCVEACNKANIRLITAGGVTENNFIEKLKIIDRNNMLEYRGVINHDAVVDVLKSCNVGLVTELNVGQNHMFDNLPTKTYEYMIMGLPVIISNYKYANELISKYQFGISVNPEDVEEIAKALEFIRDNPEEAKRMGAQGKKLILEKLNWKIEEKKLEDFYLRVLKG